MIKGMVKSTNVRTKGDVKEDILVILRSADNPKSTSDLTKALIKSWHTIDRACLMLQIEGKIEGFKIGKMNLWRAK